MGAEARQEILAQQLVDVYGRAVPVVYGFLVTRCGDAGLAEDLTAATFMAAVGAVGGGTVEEMTLPWLVTVARRRLVDHWRRLATEQRHLRWVEAEYEEAVDPWDQHLDVSLARSALMSLGTQHRAVLTLRYLDGLSVSEVADHLGRGLHATEALLQRAKAALRRAYLGGGADAD